MGESCIDPRQSSGSSTPPEQNTETFLVGGGAVQPEQVAHSVGVTLTTHLPLFVCVCV